jgi:hypothetical protein
LKNESSTFRPSFGCDERIGIEEARQAISSQARSRLITGAADDDPSGIATYSVAGAQHGTALLWTALATWPLMGCV